MTEQSPRGAGPTFRTARVFDGVGMDGRPHVDRQMLDESEAGRVLAYLESAPVVRASEGFGPDRIDPTRGRSVPLTWQTDGNWVWPGSVTYYLRSYALPPDPEFLAYIRQRNFQPPIVHPTAKQSALAAVSGLAADDAASRPTGQVGHAGQAGQVGQVGQPVAAAAGPAGAAASGSGGYPERAAYAPAPSRPAAAAGATAGGTSFGGRAPNGTSVDEPVSGGAAVTSGVTPGAVSAVAPPAARGAAPADEPAANVAPAMSAAGRERTFG
ncbi:MAG: hypothetical protein ACRDSN_24440, partial [Pseudonocardiaceae bacterium]